MSANTLDKIFYIHICIKIQNHINAPCRQTRLVHVPPAV